MTSLLWLLFACSSQPSGETHYLAVDVLGHQTGLVTTTRTPLSDGSVSVHSVRTYIFRVGEREVRAEGVTDATLDAHDRILSLSRSGDFGQVRLGPTAAGVYWLEAARAPLRTALAGEPLTLQIVAPASDELLTATLLAVDQDTVRWSTPDASGELDLSPEGRVLAARQGPVHLREAPSAPWETVDLTALLSIPASSLSHARGRHRVDLLVNGIPTRSETPLRAEIPHLPIASDEPELAAYLAPLNRSEQARVDARARAERATKGATHRVEAVEQLATYLFRTIEHRPSPGFASALDAIGRGSGDCSEQALAFVELARALGIPARRVGGVLYVEEPSPGFYPHEWVEVWYGRELGWVPADPSFAQGIADAARWPLTREVEAPLWTLLEQLPSLRLELVAP